jgi:hypothetical protein
LDIFCESVGESSSGNKETKQLQCTDFRSQDSSFILKSVGGEALKPESIENASFWTSSYILPSDGSGPKGSVSEMLTIKQKSENLTFRVVERPSSELAVLKVDQLSDHVFFKNETILLHLERGILQPVEAQSETHPLSIESIKVQGSKGACIHSVVTVKCGEYSNLLVADELSFRGMTVSDERSDRKDNVLMEFMLARALHLAFESDTDPHPCKLVMPVFVDDIGVVCDVVQRLSTEVSNKTAIAVQDSVEMILMRKKIKHYPAITTLANKQIINFL